MIFSNYYNILQFIILKFSSNNWNWSHLSCNPNISILFIHFYKKLPWKWNFVSYNPNISLKFVLQNLNLHF